MVPHLKNCLIKFDSDGGRVVSNRQRDRLQGLKHWFGRGKVDWDSGKILSVMGPLSCRLKLGVDQYQIVPLGRDGIEYVRYLDDAGRLLSRFVGDEAALMQERISFCL